MSKSLLKIWHTAATPNMMAGYVAGLFRHFCAKRGITVDNKKDFDVIFYSVYDPQDVFHLKRLREKFPDKLIIVGGIEAFSPAYLLRYADYANVGEGFEFLKNFPVDKGVPGLADWCEEQPYIASRAKVGQTIKPSYYIPWEELPVIKVGRKQYYYLCAKGCSRKCLFCMTSWCYPYMQNPIHQRKFFNKLAEGGNSIYFVGNDTGDFEPPEKSTAAASLSVKRFLQNPSKYRHKRMLHIGVEGWSEARRKFYGKPISNQEIRDLLTVTKNQNTLWEMFLIIQYPFDPTELVDAIPPDTDNYPRIYLKFTHLDPSPHTPFEDWSMEHEENIHHDDIYDMFCGKNRRFRSFPVLRVQAEHTKAMLRRSTMEQADLVVMGRRYWKAGLEAWREWIQKCGLWEVYRGKWTRQFPIEHPNPQYLKAKEKVKKKAHLIPG